MFWKKYRDNKEELKKREKFIAKSAIYAYNYARFIIKGPFPAGEEAIAKEGSLSCQYAGDVLNGPFPWSISCR